MTGKTRPRWLLKSAVTASLALAIAACGPNEYPNTTFAPLSELAVQIDALWDILLYLGLAVFVLVEVGLIYIIVRFRHKDNTPEPKHIHGHTQLEIAWTLIPAVILVFIAIPTVRTIFITQADPPANAMVIEVRGHQWWWEFRYPEYNVTTASELYLPTGRPVVLNIQTENVLHSFWIPRLAGKRDAVNRRVNKIWFTAHDSAANQVFNGFCAEYCGASHGNMQFKVFVLNEADFASWAAHQATPAIGSAAPAPAAVPAGGAPAAAGAAAAAVTSAAAVTPPAQGATAMAAPAVAQAPLYEFPRDRVPKYAIPQLAYPSSVTFDESLVGDAARGQTAFKNGVGLCIGCHTVAGVSAGLVGPNLTHVASRTTLAGSRYPMTREYMLRWIKNAPAMKPGSIMPPLAKGLTDARTGVATGTLDDQQIADIVAYLMTLK